MADRYVVPTEDGWQVQKKGAQRASAKAGTQAEAVERATEIVSNDGGGQPIAAVEECHSVAGAKGLMLKVRVHSFYPEACGRQFDVL